MESLSAKRVEQNTVGVEGWEPRPCPECNRMMKVTAPMRGSMNMRWFCDYCQAYWVAVPEAEMYPAKDFYSKGPKNGSKT